jgi:hypothetical protein
MKKYKIYRNKYLPIIDYLELVSDMITIQICWEHLGGIRENNDCSHLYGIDDILMEFLLIYPISPHLSISEVNE